jgi:hypothetical protein
VVVIIVLVKVYKSYDEIIIKWWLLIKR